MSDAARDDDDASVGSRPTPLGIYDRPKTENITSIEVIALGLSALWLVGAALFFLLLPSEAAEGGAGASSLRFLMTLLAIFMPVAMIWVAALAARASKIMREESQRLQASIDAIRQTYIAQNQSGAFGNEPTSVARKLDEIAAAARKTETVLATFSSRRDHQKTAPHLHLFRMQAMTNRPLHWARRHRTLRHLWTRPILFAL